MARVVRTSQSLEDVLEIWAYIAQDNLVAADEIVRKIDDTIGLLAENPSLGISQIHRRKNLHCKLVAGHYLVFYDTIPDGIRVVCVLHGARNWEYLL